MQNYIKKYSKFVLKPELVFALLVLPFGILSALLVPQLSVNDENMHFLRAYSIASGKLGSHNCSYPVEIVDKAEAIYDNVFSANYLQQVNLSDTRAARCGSAAIYSPLGHLPQAIGIFLAKLFYPSAGLIVLAGRLTNLIFYAAMLYLIIKHVRLGKWAFVIIGLFPMSVHVAASLSADVMNNIAVLGFFALVFNLFTQSTRMSRKQVVLLLALVGSLALTRLTNVVLLIPLLFLPVRLFKENSNSSIPFNTHKWLLGLLCAAVGILSIVTWQTVFNAPLASVHTLPSTNPLESDPLHFITILYATYFNPFIGYGDLVLRGIVGEYASFRYHIPTFLLILNLFVLLFVLLLRQPKEERLISAFALPLGISSLVAFISLILAVSYAMYTTWAIQPFRLGPDAPYADGVQGRYFTAALVSTIPIFIYLRRFVRFETNSEKTVGIIVFATSIISLSYYIVETYKYLT